MLSEELPPGAVEVEEVGSLGEAIGDSVPCDPTEMLLLARL